MLLYVSVRRLRRAAELDILSNMEDAHLRVLGFSQTEVPHKAPSLTIFVENEMYCYREIWARTCGSFNLKMNGEESGQEWIDESGPWSQSATYYGTHSLLTPFSNAVWSHDLIRRLMPSFADQDTAAGLISLR
jgi:hypothetical protein